MPKVTLLARLSDGLPLAASMADENDAYAKEVSSERLSSIVLKNDPECFFNMDLETRTV